MIELMQIDRDKLLLFNFEIAEAFFKIICPYAIGEKINSPQVKDLNTYYNIIIGELSDYLIYK